MTTRIFYATDIHGSEKCFMKFINAASFYKADVLIMGGDITGKLIVPIVEQPDGSYAANFLGNDLIVRSGSDLEKLEKNIRFNGYYPYYTNPKEKEEIDRDKERLDHLFSMVMVDTMERWVRIAAERLMDSSVKCLITPGNDDRFDIDPVLGEADVVVNPEGAVVQIDKYHEVISTGWSNFTPWHSPRECSEEELAKKIEAMTLEVRDVGNCIFNFHCPPINSKIDLAPKLDGQMRPVIGPEGRPMMVPAGSTSVRSAIENHQPLLGLHGHIHESRGFTRIGRTLCLNPGSEYSEGILGGAIINIDERKVKNFLLVSG